MQQDFLAPDLVYKVLDLPEFETARDAGVFDGAPVDLRDGFIHLSTAEQLRETLSKHFAGRADLILAAVEVSALGDDLKWEVSRGGALFPHLYASLPLTAVVWTMPIAVSADGETDLPEAVQ